MKILVIGGSGLIGSHLLKAGRVAGHTVAGTYRKFPIEGLTPFDSGSAAQTKQLMDETAPDAVVYAAGLTWADACEDDPVRAEEENTVAPARMAAICQARKIHFTYISSSYVFDGKNGPYDETVQPNPINVYARTKWEGEQRVQSACDGTALIPRVICVYGAEAQKKNFAYQVWNALRDGKTMVLPTDQCGNPTYAADIARWLVALLEKRGRGGWHLGGPWPDCTRPEWAGKLVAAFGMAGIQPQAGFAIRPAPTSELKQRALRPLKAGLVSVKTTEMNFQPTEFNQSIRELVRETR